MCFTANPNRNILTIEPLFGTFVARHVLEGWPASMQYIFASINMQQVHIQAE
jgi:hypothetical protein